MTKAKAPSAPTSALSSPSAASSPLSGDPARLSDTAEIDARPTPLLGEHAREPLHDLGYSHDEIDTPYSEGVVKTEEPAKGLGK